MGLHQHDPNANELWLYFQGVIAWVRATFPNWRKHMKGVAWGPLYNNFKSKPLDAVTLEDTVKTLMMDDEVQKKSGIYSYETRFALFKQILLLYYSVAVNLKSFCLSARDNVYSYFEMFSSPCLLNLQESLM